MPLPLVLMGLWLTTLAAILGFYAWDNHRDRQARARIGSFTHDEPLPRPTIDPPDEFTELDREWCAMKRIGL